MFSLRRCCVGAALGLSLLACGPAKATPFPVTNPHFQTNGTGVITGWSPTGTGSLGAWHLHPGHASITTGARGLSQTNSVVLSKNVTYTLIGHYTLRGTVALGIGLATPGQTAFPSSTPRYKAIGIVTGGTRTGTFTFKTMHTKTFGGTLRFYGNVETGTVEIRGLDPAAPEIDGDTAAAPLALALGGLVLMEDRRRAAKSSSG